MKDSVFSLFMVSGVKRFNSFLTFWMCNYLVFNPSRLLRKKRSLAGFAIGTRKVWWDLNQKKPCIGESWLMFGELTLLL